MNEEEWQAIKALFAPPAEAAPVLAFPAQMRCSRCVHFTADAEGIPVCTEFEDVVDDDAQAQDCDEYEVR